jgi:hypothetical protein
LGDREGTFTPSVPFWKRVFNPPPAAKEPIITFPPDKALSSSPPAFKKLERPGIRPNSTSFKPLRHSDSSDDDSDDDGKYIPRPWAKKRATTSLSGVTLAGSNSDKGKDKAAIDYSDGESVTPSQKKPRMSRDSPGWTPEFIRKGKDKDVESGSVELEQKRNRSESPPPGAVPITPSLLNALERVGKAQSAAYAVSKSSGQSQPSPAVSMPEPQGYDWGAFWRNVEDKAKEPERPARHAGL